MKRSFYAFTLLLLTGCTASNNMHTIKADVALQEKQMKEMAGKINTIEDERIAKESAGKLDDNTDLITSTYIKSLKDSVNTRLAFYKIIIADNSPVSKDKKKIRAYLQSVERNYGKELNNVVFLDDLFKAEKK